MHKKGFYETYIKRPQDVLLSSLALVLLSPVIGVTAIMVRTKLGSPVIFKQERPGLNGKIFKLYKFRTMTVKHGGSTVSVAGDARITPLGAT